MYPWQSALINELALPANNRSIVWYADLLGGSGKTQLCRYMVSKLERVLFFTSTRGTDAYYHIIKARFTPRIVLVNLARGGEGKINYAMFENVKDGIIFSGKYETGSKIFASPHVIVFANWLPDMAMLTEDRWVIRHLEQNRLRNIQ